MNNLDALKARRDRLDRLQVGIDLEIARQEMVASIPEPDAKVVKIKRKIGNRSYLYSATRVGVDWYPTGMSRNIAYTWPRLMAMLAEDATELVVEVPTGWSKTKYDVS